MENCMVSKIGNPCDSKRFFNLSFKTAEPIYEKRINLQVVDSQQLGDLLCVDTWIRTKDPHHVKVIL